METEEELIENMAIALCDAKWSESELIVTLTKFVSSINSTRLSERRANGSNSKAKKFDIIRIKQKDCIKGKDNGKWIDNINIKSNDWLASR